MIIKPLFNEVFSPPTNFEKIFELENVRDDNFRWLDRHVTNLITLNDIMSDEIDAFDDDYEKAELKQCVNNAILNTKNICNRIDSELFSMVFDVYNQYNSDKKNCHSQIYDKTDKNIIYNNGSEYDIFIKHRVLFENNNDNHRLNLAYYNQLLLLHCDSDKIDKYNEIFDCFDKQYESYNELFWWVCYGDHGCDISDTPMFKMQTEIFDLNDNEQYKAGLTHLNRNSQRVFVDILTP